MLYEEILIIISNSFNFFFESMKAVLGDMVAIFMTSAQLITLGLFKSKDFGIKVMTSLFQLMTSSAKFYRVSKTIL